MVSPWLRQFVHLAVILILVPCKPHAGIVTNSWLIVKSTSSKDRFLKHAISRSLWFRLSRDRIVSPYALQAKPGMPVQFPFFFFQAEDGIRVPLVTGVQTCALPI